MKRFHSLKLRLRAGVGFAVIAVLLFGLSRAVVIGADTKPAETKAAEAKPADVKPAKPASKKLKLTGAELYAVNCNRCHPERYPTEFNSAQWKTLMTHMRVRANLPAAQAKLILKYLQEDSGN